MVCFYIFISMNLKKIIREEIGDLDWINDVKGEYDVDVSEDYWGVWGSKNGLILPFIKSGVQELKGYVNSNDYDGTITISLSNPLFEMIIEVEMGEYNEDKDRSLIEWTIIIHYTYEYEFFKDTISDSYYTDEFRNWEPIKNSITKLIMSKSLTKREWHRYGDLNKDE